MRPPTTRSRSAAALLSGCVLAGGLLGGCGSSGTPPTVHTSSVQHAGPEQRTAAVPGGCAALVMKTLRRIDERVYHEGVKSQRTGSAEYELASSPALRAAVEAGNASAARAAARKLIRTGHLTNLLLIAHGRTLVNLGGKAITPIHGTIENAAGEAIASYTTSVWSDEGFLAETGGVIEGYAAIREGQRTVASSLALGSEALAAEGTLSHPGLRYRSIRYVSFPGEAFPSGALRIYLFRPNSTIAPLCRSSSEATVVSVLHHIAELIYAIEHGPPARHQVARVEANVALREAVRRRDPVATEAAIKALLNQHIVRLRVYGPAGELLGDVGGPYVLAPVHGGLRAGGRRIGSFVLSVQDDEGYEKLARRLEGLDVLVYYDGQIVKNSLGPVSWSEVPATGRFTYAGRDYRVFTVRGEAFPSGPVVVRVLVPEPYLSQPIAG